MEDRNRFTTYNIGEWLELHRRNNQQTILLLGSRAGALYRSLPFYNYCQQYTPHHLQIHSLIWSFRECYQVLLRQQLGERELHAVLHDAFKPASDLLGDGDRYFAEMIRTGYFREIISTNIDDVVERALQDNGLIEESDFEVVILGEQTLPKERKLPYRLTKVFGDWLSREYMMYNRQLYIVNNNGLNQYLQSILQGNVLAIGIDPLWDGGILPLLHDTPTTLWFVNEEAGIVDDKQVASILDQTQSVAVLGQNCMYEEVGRSLYQQLCMKTPLKDRAMRDSHYSFEREDDRSQQDKKAVRILYIYCDDDLSMMEEFWTSLAVLRRKQLIEEWHRGFTRPGEHLQLTQERQLRRSQLIFIGFSANFISSEYYDQALQAHELSKEGTVRLVPLLLHPIAGWKETPFSELATLPDEGKILSQLLPQERDKVLNKIANDIYELVKRLQKGEDDR